MDSQGGRSVRRIVPVLVVVLAVTVAGCAGFGTDATDENASPDGEPATDDSGNESTDGESNDTDDATDTNDANGGSDSGESADEGNADADAAPDESTENGSIENGSTGNESTESENAEVNESTVEETETAEGTLEIHAIDVGQGDATLIVGPEETMLIDSGDWRDDGETVIAYLESQGIERIDYLVTTHAHADHIGGHAAVIEHYETEHDGVGEVWDPGVSSTSRTYENYLDAVEEHDVDLIRARSGDEIDFAGGTTVLNPPAESGSDDLHENSLSVRVTHGETAFLATGDAESETEERMVEEHGDALEADVYQVGHHGSSTSSSDAFLDRVDPEYAIISSAYDSQYGHPHEEVLAAFDERGVETYWTAVHGSIVVESDGEELSVEPETDATTDPSELREEPPVDEADETEGTDEEKTGADAATAQTPTPIHTPKAIA
ncbi:ComEC/Rec2 family competence protein [Halalkalicoccus salilacus]|uniref:ComEC/Rec2 family competence protein n=1 Tax=Halalkalicoccus salilacus TaxID=3117459 RepID=UPI00300F2D8C